GAPVPSSSALRYSAALRRTGSPRTAISNPASPLAFRRCGRLFDRALPAANKFLHFLDLDSSALGHPAGKLQNLLGFRKHLVDGESLGRHAIVYRRSAGASI